MYLAPKYAFYRVEAAAEMDLRSDTEKFESGEQGLQVSTSAPSPGQEPTCERPSADTSTAKANPS